MSGFDVGMLLNTQGVQLPDPVASMGKALTLADLARRNRVGAVEEEKAQRELEAGKAYDTVAGDLAASGHSTDAAIAAIQKNPRAAAMIWKDVETRQKAKLETAKTSAEINKINMETRGKGHGIASAVANVILTRPGGFDPREVETAAGVLTRMGIDPMQFGDPRQDPQTWLETARASGYETAKQIEHAMTAGRDAETGRHNLRTEDLTATRDQATAGYQQGMLGSHAADRSNRLQVANIHADATRANAEATRDAAREGKLNTETQALAKFVNSNALPGLMTSVGTLDATMKKYANVRDIPGVGPLDARAPSLLRSADGNKVRSQIQGVTNDLLKLYSGGAVTLNESERRTLEMMASGNFTEEDLRNAWPLIKGRVNAAINNVRAGFSPEAVSTYEGRGGLKLRPIGESDVAPAATESPVAKETPGGAQGLPRPGNREDYIREAKNAIQRGVNPAKVRARLRELGVTGAEI